MAKMYFAKTVRYQGTKYYPNTVFEVKEEDILDLKASGGWVVENPAPVRLAEPVEPELIDEDPIEPEEVVVVAKKPSARKPKKVAEE